MAEASDAQPACLAQQLIHWAQERPGHTAYTFLHQNGSAQTISYAELAACVAARAAQLLAHARPGARALLLYPAGLDFIVAFFACLAAGVVAVPAAPANRSRDGARLKALLADAAPALVLCAPQAQALTAAALLHAGASLPLLAEPLLAEPLLATSPRAAAGALPLPAADSVAFLQYTSGSTGQPKGVEITHANIGANLVAIGRAFGFAGDTVMVSWLPPFHDMGLIGSIAAPVWFGFHCVLMAPGSFLRRPASWLEAISAYRATCSGGPNFAWDLCLRRISAEQQARLDLSSLEVLYNGAEPVRAATLTRFLALFGPCGLRAGAVFPCYGMAEATLLVAGSPRGRGARILTLDAAALERGRVQPLAPAAAAGAARQLVSCGPPATGTLVAVVDPARGVALAAGEIGELWIAGAGVACGYHGRAQDSARLFGLRIAQAPAPLAGARWLRSGDLGFIEDGEVYVSGRCKDLIVIHGRKLHAQDIEALAESACPELAPNSCAAFACDSEQGEGLALVVEASRALTRSGETDALGRRLRARIAGACGVVVHTLAFVPAGLLPRTTSGKVQRARCKAMLQEGSLPFLQGRASAHQHSAQRADGAIAWLRSYAARRLDSRLADERRTLAPHVLLDFGRHGLFGLQAPCSDGGLDLRLCDLVRVMAQLAAIDLTLATVVGVHNGLGLRPLLRFAAAPLRAQWLAPLAAGRQLAAFALSEPQAGSNPRAMASRARRTSGGWLLDGEKYLIGLAPWAGVLTVLARAVDSDGRALGTLALLVAADAPGVHLGEEALTMGMRAMPQSALRFENVFVADAQVLGEPGKGMDVARDAMGFARLGIGALCLGAMQRCAQLMARYAARRDIAGGRLLDHPVTRLRLHELDCAISAAQSLLALLAGEVDAGASLPPDACSACKCVLSELLWEAVDRLLQMLGGRGYLETNPAAQLLRDARVLRILEGPSETLYAHLGALLRQPGNALAALIARGAPDPAAAQLTALPASGSGAWQDSRNGEFAAWTLLAVCARGEAAQWAARRVTALRTAIEAEADVAATCPSGSALLARLARHTAAIGDIEQAAPGEGRGLDPILRQAAPQARATVALPAAAPSKLELVRDCLQRWLREGGLEGGFGGGLEDGLGCGVDAALPLGAGAPGGLCAPPAVPGGTGAPWTAGAGWDLDTPFTDLGIDSLAAVPLALEIEQASAIPVSAELLHDYPTVRLLAAYLDAHAQAGSTPQQAPALPVGSASG